MYDEFYARANAYFAAQEYLARKRQKRFQARFFVTAPCILIPWMLFVASVF